MSERFRRLEAWLEFYEELGLTPFYRRVRAPQAEAARFDYPRPQPARPAEPVPARSAAPEPAAVRAAPRPSSNLSLFGEPPPRVEDDTLQRISDDIGDCRRCKLWRGRKTIVFGEGNPRAELVFVGEGPGADEDAQGRPFVGRAGQLLNHWIGFLGRKREDVYICNVIKCRPPGNRTPEKDEIQTCSQFLLRQLDVIQPRIICCLGGVALQTLLGKSLSITRARGQFFDYQRSKLTATFHPAYLLRNPAADRQVKEDLRKIRQFLD